MSKADEIIRDARAVEEWLRGAGSTSLAEKAEKVHRLIIARSACRSTNQQYHRDVMVYRALLKGALQVLQNQQQDGPERVALIDAIRTALASTSPGAHLKDRQE